jgi:hypothetical protein
MYLENVTVSCLITAFPIKGTPARTYRRPRLSFFRFNCQTATTNLTPKQRPPNTSPALTAEPKSTRSLSQLSRTIRFGTPREARRSRVPAAGANRPCRRCGRFMPPQEPTVNKDSNFSSKNLCDNFFRAHPPLPFNLAGAGDISRQHRQLAGRKQLPQSW